MRNVLRCSAGHLGKPLATSETGVREAEVEGKLERLMGRFDSELKEWRL